MCAAAPDSRPSCCRRSGSGVTGDHGTPKAEILDFEGAAACLCLCLTAVAANNDASVCTANQ